MDINIICVNASKHFGIHIPSGQFKGIWFPVDEDWTEISICASYLKDAINDKMVYFKDDLINQENSFAHDDYCTFLQTIYDVARGVFRIIHVRNISDAEEAHVRSILEPIATAPEPPKPSPIDVHSNIYFDHDLGCGMYGSNRNIAEIENILGQVAGLLDKLARTQGIATVVVSTDLFQKNNKGTYEPIVSKDDKEADKYYDHHLGPIIDNRKHLRAVWERGIDIKNGFHLSA